MRDKQHLRPGNITGNISVLGFLVATVKVGSKRRAPQARRYLHALSTIIKLYQ